MDAKKAQILRILTAMASLQKWKSEIGRALFSWKFTAPRLIGTFSGVLGAASRRTGLDREYFRLSLEKKRERKESSVL